MRRRIFGLETEYGLTCASTTGQAPPLDAEQAAQVLFEPLVRAGRSTNVFLANGGRLYLDVGAHPEYATAECADLWDLLAQVRAGSSMLAELADQANRTLSARDIPGSIHLFANNLDSQGNSFGCHENYLLRRSRDFREMADALVSFLVTRQIICGAGALTVRDEGDGLTYTFSARADQIDDALSGATTRSRPIINTRDEPLSDSTAYRRLHVIVGDTNIAEPTTALKVASTDLVLAALEGGVDLGDLALADPMSAIRTISTDLSGQSTVLLSDGRALTAAQIQAEIKARVLLHLGHEPLPDLYRYLVDLWERAILAVQTADWRGIDTEIDYAIKKKILDAYQERTGAPLSDPKVSRLALAYHDITGDDLRARLEETGMMLRLTSPAQIQAAKEVAPPTRARLRGQAIAAAIDARRDLGADWVTLRLEGAGQTVNLTDPFATTDPRVDSLIDSIRGRQT